MPKDAYRAATEKLAWRDRSDRSRLLVSGRAPVKMLDGILTQSVPEAPARRSDGTAAGGAAYSAVLTAKGRMVTDLRVLRLEPVEGSASEPGGAERLLLEVPAPGQAGLRAHLGHFLPPRLARVEDVSEETGMVTILGPDAAAWLSLEALGLRVDTADLESMVAGEYRLVGGGGREAFYVLRTDEVATAAFDFLADRASVEALCAQLTAAGAPEADEAAWTTLRIEAGRPAFGVDMDEETIPVEAGIHLRAIDYGKGCYTGQEVIVRLRDRGHVNRHLRTLTLGSVPPPPAGTGLFAPESLGDRSAGVITSAGHSPRRGGTIALGYVRREVRPGTEVHLGEPGGPPASVVGAEDGSDA